MESIPRSLLRHEFTRRSGRIRGDTPRSPEMGRHPNTAAMAPQALPSTPQSITGKTTSVNNLGYPTPNATSPTSAPSQSSTQSPWNLATPDGSPTQEQEGYRRFRCWHHRDIFEPHSKPSGPYRQFSILDTYCDAVCQAAGDSSARRRLAELRCHPTHRTFITTDRGHIQEQVVLAPVANPEVAHSPGDDAQRSLGRFGSSRSRYAAYYGRVSNAEHQLRPIYASCAERPSPWLHHMPACTKVLLVAARSALARPMWSKSLPLDMSIRWSGM